MARKKMIVVVFLLMLLPFYATGNLKSTIYGKSTIYVYPENKLVCVNQTFYLEIKVTPAEPIYSAICNISFDPSILQVIDVFNGDMFDIWIDAILNIDNMNGTISYIMGATNESISEEGVFAFIKFKSISTGVSYINIQNPYVGGMTYPDLNVINGTVNVIFDNTPPSTSIEFGSPYYNGWITSSTPVYLNATDDGIGVNATYYRVFNGTWTPWMEYLHPFTIKGDGIHHIEFYSIDAIGNVEELHNKSICIDNSPPEIYMDYTPHYSNGNEWVNGSETIFVNASDIIPYSINVSIFLFSNSSWKYYEGSSISFNLQHGKNWINITAKDALNNFACMNKTLYCDAKTPSTYIILQPPDGENGWYVSNVTVILNAVDNESGINKTFYAIDNNDISIYNGSFVMVEDGIHVLKYYSIDNVGNAEKPNIYTLKIDKTPPYVELIKYPSSPTNKNNITFMWNGSDNLTPYKNLRYSYMLAGYDANWHDWNGIQNASYNNIPDGSYTFFVRIKDEAGNENITSKNITIDTSPPEIKDIEAYPYIQKIGGYVNISCSVEGIEIEKVNLSISYPDSTIHNFTMNKGNATYYYNASYVMVGIYNFTIYATDSASNTGYGNGSFMISDLTPPQVNISYPSGGEIVDGKLLIEWNASDNYDSKDDIKITIKYSPDDGATWRLVAKNIENNGSYLFNTRGLRDGKKYRVEVMAYDSAGNIGRDISGIFIIDNTSPEIEIKKPMEGYVYFMGRQILPVFGNRAIVIGKITVEASVEDETAGVEKVEFYIDGIKKYETKKEPYSWEWNEMAIGKHEIKVIAYDRAGNKKEEKVDVTALIL